MRKKRAGGHTHLWTEHLQTWIWEAYPADTYTVSPNLTQWIKVVEIIRFIWDTGFIPTELGWTVLVIIPKVNSANQGIRLLEVVWKVVEEVIDTRIKSVVQFHDILHGFCAGRGKGTNIMEL